MFDLLIKNGCLSVVRRSVTMVLMLSLCLLPMRSLVAQSEGVAATVPMGMPAAESDKHAVPGAQPVIDDTLSPEKLIELATNRLIQRLLAGSSLDKREQSDYYRRAVEEVVAPLIDFERIARRVMSKHYKLATEAQRDAFAKVFRESLVDTYTKGITGYSDEEIKMLPFKGIRVSKKSKVERAKVEMEIRTKEGDVLPIIYQVYKNASGQWRLENMILSGVNLGLTYRNQFNESLKSEKGNLDHVIQNWNVSAVATEGANAS